MLRMVAQDHVPEHQHARKIKKNQAEDRDAAENLNRGKLAQAIVSIDNHTADGTKKETRCGFAETENSQRPCRSGYFVSKPVERHFADELTDRRDQIARPKECIVLVLQRPKDANGTTPRKSKVCDGRRLGGVC